MNVNSCSLVRVLSIALMMGSGESELLGTGENCGSHSECESGLCVTGTLTLGSIGTCQCDVETNAGCDGGKTCVSIDDGPQFCTSCGDPEKPCMENWDLCREMELGGCPSIIVEESCPVGFSCADEANDADEANTTTLLLPIGAPCDYDGTRCETGNCFYGWWSPNPVCSCDVYTNAGCSSGLECAINILDDGPPFCSLPDGASCVAEEQTDCSAGTCCKSGVCLNDVCVAAPTLPFGSSCREDSNCDTGACYHGFKPPGTAGVCQCNPSTDAGCMDGLKCASSNVIADAPPFCGKPLASGCTTGSDFECASENCFSGTCQCNHIFNSGCQPTEKCVGDETVGYQCQGPETPSPAPAREDETMQSTSPPPVVVLNAANNRDIEGSGASDRPNLVIGFVLGFSSAVLMLP